MANICSKCGGETISQPIDKRQPIICEECSRKCQECGQKVYGYFSQVCPDCEGKKAKITTFKKGTGTIICNL